MHILTYLLTYWFVFCLWNLLNESAGKAISEQWIRKWSWPDLIYYPEMANMDLRKATKGISQAILFLGQDTITGSPECEAGALPTGTRSNSITLCETINLLAVTHVLYLLCCGLTCKTSPYD
jgi:hypothetical protein